MSLTQHAHVQANYTKYVEPYVNKIPRASTSTTGTTKPTMVDSTAESMPPPPVHMPPIMSEPKKVI